MKQYWINQNGVQSGPLTIEQLRAMDVSTKAYVWHSGLDDWVKIAEVPELAQMFSGADPVEGEKAEDAVAGIPMPPVEGEKAEDAVAGIPLPPVEGEKVEDAVAGTPLPPQELPANMPPIPPAAPAMPAVPAAAADVDNTQPAEQPKCPPTNLVWAILVTILCCLPTGVFAIVYSAKVISKYNEGDYKAAEHYSEVSAWWCIGSIILGIIIQPFVTLLQAAIMG